MTIKEPRSVTELSPRKLEQNWSRFAQMEKSKPKLEKVLEKDFHLLEETLGREKVKNKFIFSVDKLNIEKPSILEVLIELENLGYNISFNDIIRNFCSIKFFCVKAILTFVSCFFSCDL